jgi:hypothetical protein
MVVRYPDHEQQAHRVIAGGQHLLEALIDDRERPREDALEDGLLPKELHAEQVPATQAATGPTQAGPRDTAPHPRAADKQEREDGRHTRVPWDTTVLGGHSKAPSTVPLQSPDGQRLCCLMWASHQCQESAMRARYSLRGGRVHEQLVQAAEQGLVGVLVVTRLCNVGDDGRGLHLLQDNNDQAVSPQLCQHKLCALEEDPVLQNAEPWVAKTGDPHAS